MAITTRDGLIASMTAGQQYLIAKNSSGTSMSGRLFSLWTSTGAPTAGATPSTATTCDRTTQGAIPLPAPSGSNTWYLHGFEMTNGATPVAVALYDRAAHMGGLSGTVTTAQTVDVSAPARFASKAGVYAYLECYTSLGSVASATVTMSYTNQDGTSGRTGTLSGGIPASMIGRTLLGPFELEGTDTGVSSVQTVTSTTSTTTAGNFGITLGRRVVAGMMTGSTSGGGFRLGYAETGLPDVGASPCLWLVVMSVTTGTQPAVTGGLQLCQG